MFDCVRIHIRDISEIYYLTRNFFPGFCAIVFAISASFTDLLEEEIALLLRFFPGGGFDATKLPSLQRKFSDIGLIVLKHARESKEFYYLRITVLIRDSVDNLVQVIHKRSETCLGKNCWFHFLFSIVFCFMSLLTSDTMYIFYTKCQVFFILLETYQKNPTLICVRILNFSNFEFNIIWQKNSFE